MNTQINLPPAPTGMTPSINFQVELHQRAMRERFCEICPPLYRDTDKSRLDGLMLANTMAFKRALNRGLMIVGESGKGKTRCMWLLIQRLLCVEGVPVRAINDTLFSVEYSKRLGNGTAEDWIDRLSRVSVLFIDDLGKAAPTARHKEAFYSVLEARSANMLPTLITTNYGKDGLLARFGADDGAAIVRRIVEFCEIIKA